MLVYRSEGIGSLLRPAYLLDARAGVERGDLTPAEFKRIEDRAVDEAVALQEAAGLDVVTDGEQRRYAFFGHLVEAFEGFEKSGGWSIPFRDGEGTELTLRRPVVVDRLRPRRQMSVEEFAYLRGRTTRAIKITLISAQQAAAYYDPDKSAGAYPTRDAYLADIVDFTRRVTPGTVLAKDRKRGSVYLLEWPARHETGGGPVDSTRHILVFQTSQGKWLLIAEGPGATESHAQHKTTTTTTHYEVDWTQDSLAPVEIRAIRSTHITFTSDDAQASINSTHDFTLAGPLPSRFHSTSDDYLESRYGDTLADIALRVATCGTFYPLERTAALKSKMIENVTESLADLNPKLSKKPRPGSRILLPNLSTLWDDANHAAGIKNHPSH